MLKTYLTLEEMDKVYNKLAHYAFQKPQQMQLCTLQKEKLSTGKRNLYEMLDTLKS